MFRKHMHVVFCTLISSFAIGEEIKRPHLMAPAELRNVRLFHKDNLFVIEQDGEEKVIQPCDVSPIIRNASPELLSKFLVADGYLKLSELRNENGSINYKLYACNRLRGGGLGGAFWGAAVGQFIGNAIVYTGIGVASAAVGGAAFFVGGPPAAAIAGGATFHSLQATVVPLAQPFIHGVAIASGIAGGVATGPV